jgi:methionyl-tRNA formyltransferase
MIAGDAIRPTVLAAGFKGALFVAGLLDAGIKPLRIVSYRQPDDKSDSFNRLTKLSGNLGIEFEESHHPDITEDSLVFLVGWQFLLRNGLNRCIVFHDSLLPELRGFTPTVTALIIDSDVIGVTALRPNDGIDTGPICGRRSIRISSGITIRGALELQSQAMVDLAIEVLQRVSDGTLMEQTQDQNSGTLSLWRDEYDYFIDWRTSAPEILRFVQALGFPYSGAKGVIDNQIVTIQNVTYGLDLVFAIRNPGKLWQVEDRRALVVCGSGTLWIEEAYKDNGEPFHFKYLRSRFITPDTAWIAPFMRFAKNS